MKIIPLKSVKAHPVKSWSEIKKDAAEMAAMLKAGNFSGMWKEGLALSHCQVNNEDPKDFFVLHDDIKEAFDGFTVFANAMIIEADDLVPFKEACLSYGHRPQINTKRYHHLVIEADVHNPLKIFGSGFSRRTFQLNGIAAFIAQHEIDHAKGIDIFHKFKK